MRVLGIDPGSRNTGLGVIDANGRDITLVEFRTIRMGSEPLAQRLGRIFEGVGEIIHQARPDMVAVEQVFVSNNAKSALVLGQARGAAICAAVQAGIEVSEYSALQVKQSVVGTGSARKEQVQHMVTRLLRLPATPQEDASDALAAALCHINGEQARALTGDQYGGGRRRR